MPTIVTPTAEINKKMSPYEAAQQLVDSWQPLLQNCRTQESLNEMLVFCLASILRDRKENVESVPEGDAWILAQKTGPGISVKMLGSPAALSLIFCSALDNPEFKRILMMSLLMSDKAITI